MMTPLVDDWTALPPGVPSVEIEEALPSALGFKPFGYQQDGFNAIWKDFDSGIHSTLVAMATGLGKTCLAAMVAKEAIEQRDWRVLFLAHRDELLEGAQEDFSLVGVPTAIEKAEQKARKTIKKAESNYFHRQNIKCVVGSVPSFHDKNLDSWERDYFDLIITDETHHNVRMEGPKRAKRTVANEQYGRIYRHFPNAKRMGLTGSPRRKDLAELGYWYETIAYQYLLDKAIDNGDLCKVDVVQCDVKIDLSKVNMGASDLNQGDLEEAISPHVEQMVRAVKENIGDRRFLMFTPGRKSRHQKFRPCQAFAEGFRKVGISSEAVWGEHPDRLAINRGFKANEFQSVCNADLYNEGVNFPFIQAVVMGSPTASPVVMGQRMGRGTRLYPGKEKCLIVTFDWQFEEHKLSLIMPYQIIRPDAAEDVQALTASIIKSGEETDLLKAADLAEERAKEERERREAEEKRRKFEEEVRQLKAEQVKRQKAEAQQAKRDRLERERLNLRVRPGESGLNFRTFDPFASSIRLAGLQVRPGERGTPATVAQINVLLSYGVPESEANRLSFDQAKAMRTWCFDRYNKQLAPLWLVRKLISAGVAESKALQLRKGEAFEMREKLGLNRVQRYG